MSDTANTAVTGNPATVVHHGITLPIDKKLMSPKIIDAVKTGRYEKQEAKGVARILAEGERVLEIGGGIGFISSLVAKSGMAEKVRVYEANPELIPFIERVHDMNDAKNVEVVNAVLSNAPTDEPATFYLRKSFWSSSLSPEPFGYERTTPVPVRSFSTEIEKFRPTLIICDIEGGELDLFENANLNGVKKVYMEIHQKVLGRRGVKRLFDAMSARMFHYDQNHSAGSVILFSHVDR